MKTPRAIKILGVNAAWWAHAVLEIFAPLEKLPSIDEIADQLAGETEPPLTDVELIALRQLIEERFPNEYILRTSSADLSAAEENTAPAVVPPAAGAGTPLAEISWTDARAAAIGISQWLAGEQAPPGSESAWELVVDRIVSAADAHLSS